jgi:tubulin monoglycylase TTLL15
MQEEHSEHVASAAAAAVLRPNSAAVESSVNLHDLQHRSTVWIYGKKLEAGYLKHVFNVFERIGYEIGDHSTDWDVLWSHDYPFNVLSQHLHNLKPHQKVNHFPGSGILTNKATLIVSDLSVIPKAFRIPSQYSELLQYAQEHPDKLWVQKDKTHRGIRITSVNDVKATENEVIVQEYVDNPFLIDGRRFDIGLYVTITSVSPIREYVFPGDWLLRFCSKTYNPFDAADTDKYVITDDYTPPWDIPPIAKFYSDMGCTRKEALFAYMRSIGKDPDKVNRDLEAAVRQVCYAKESALIEAMSRGYSPRNFFEMVRFDFVLDADLNVYLMEINMSPNLSSGHFVRNKLLYEQVIYGTLSLVGIATSVSLDAFRRNSEDAANMQVSSRDVRVYVDTCSRKCNAGCQQQVCKLCRECAADEDISIFKTAYLEHTRGSTWNRVVPKPLETKDVARRWNATLDVEFQQLNPANQIMFLWYRGKCLQRAEWCF